MSKSPSSATLVSLFLERVAQSGDRPGLHVRDGGQDYRAVTWAELAADARRTAAALVAAGLQPGDRLAQVSENRYEWIVLDLAAHLARGVHVAIHCSLSGPQIAEQIADCGARLLIVSTAEQAAKLSADGVVLSPELRVYSHEIVPPDLLPIQIDSWPAFVAAATEETGGRIEAEALAAVRPGDLATILYTSGTTGEPKGVMLSHGNLASNALASVEAFGSRKSELRLGWLPLSHIYARTSDLYASIADGSELALAQSRETIIADCRATKPTFMNGVPYFYDKIFRHLRDQGLADTPGSLKELLGGRLSVCCAGGTALGDEIARFFERQGIVLAQGYGLTESSPVITTGTPSANRIGSVGPPIPGVEVRVAPDGEILTRGPHVMLGYWNRPQATADAIRDGWLQTGDLGRLEDGYLYITGRKKELIVTAAGKNVAPVYLEGLLTADPLIAQAVVIGDGRNFLTALIVPDREALRAEIMQQGIPVSSPAEALAHERVRALYAERIRERLAGVSSYEQIGGFELLPRALSIETGELTPTLKPRREIIRAQFADVIERMYAV